MAEISQEQIEAVVSEFLEKLRSSGSIQKPSSSTSDVSVLDGLFDTAERAVAAAKQAQTELLALGFKKRNELIAAIRQVSLEQAQSLAELAVRDTGMGVVEHKYQKNEGAAIIKHANPCGVSSEKNQNSIKKNSKEFYKFIEKEKSNINITNYIFLLWSCFGRHKN